MNFPIKNLLKWTVFAALSVASFFWSYSYYTRTVLTPVTSPEEVGVSINFDLTTKAATVTMDGKTEVVPITNFATSKFVRQATDRIGLRMMAKLHDRQTEVWWGPLIGRWLTFELVLFLLILKL